MPYGNFDASKVITPAEAVYHIKRYRFHINVDGPKVQDLTLAYLHFLGLSLNTVDMFAKVMTPNNHSELVRLHYRIVGKQQHEPDFESVHEEDSIMNAYYELLQDYYTMACLLQLDSRSDEDAMMRHNNNNNRNSNSLNVSHPTPTSYLTRRIRTRSPSTHELLSSMERRVSRSRSNTGAVVDDAFSSRLSPLTRDMMTSNPPFHREAEICFTPKRSNSLISMMMSRHYVFEAGQVFLAPFYLNGKTMIRVIAMTLDGNNMRRFWLKMTSKQSSKHRGRIWRPRNKGVVRLFGVDGEEMLRLRVMPKLWNDWVISVRLSRAWNQSVGLGFDVSTHSCRRQDGASDDDDDDDDDDDKNHIASSSKVLEATEEEEEKYCSKSPLMMSTKSYRKKSDRKSTTNMAARFSAERRQSTPSPMSSNNVTTTPRTPPNVITIPSPHTLFRRGSSRHKSAENTLMSQMLKSECSYDGLQTPDLM